MKTARASRPRSSTVSYAYAYTRERQRIPRRTSEEDAQARYRQRKFGQPGLVDAWLAARLSQIPSQSQSQNHSLQPPERQDGSADEVRCVVHVQCIKAPSDGSIFSDPDTFVLRLTTSPSATTLSATRRLGLGGGEAQVGLGVGSGGGESRMFELGKYEGHLDSLDAPQWTKLLPAGQSVEFQTSAAAVAELLRRAAPWKDAMTYSLCWSRCAP